MPHGMGMPTLLLLFVAAIILFGLTRLGPR
jgi:Sec-independent protein translocase protein TatA